MKEIRVDENTNPNAMSRKRDLKSFQKDVEKASRYNVINVDELSIPSPEPRSRSFVGREILSYAAGSVSNSDVKVKRAEGPMTAEPQEHTLSLPRGSLSLSLRAQLKKSVSDQK